MRRSSDWVLRLCSLYNRGLIGADGDLKRLTTATLAAMQSGLLAKGIRSGSPPRITLQGVIAVLRTEAILEYPRR